MPHLFSRSVLLAIVSLPQAHASAAGAFTGGWCRVSTAALTTYDKDYLPFEKRVYGIIADNDSCNAKCLSAYGNKLACSSWERGAACYCLLNRLDDANPVETICWSPLADTEAYINLASKPAPCGQGLDYCRADTVQTSVGHDCCAAWSINTETTSCTDGSTPVPSGSRCWTGAGETYHCCSSSASLGGSLNAAAANAARCAIEPEDSNGLPRVTRLLPLLGLIGFIVSGTIFFLKRRRLLCWKPPPNSPNQAVGSAIPPAPVVQAVAVPVPVVEAQAVPHA